MFAFERIFVFVYLQGEFFALDKFLILTGLRESITVMNLELKLFHGHHHGLMAGMVMVKKPE